MVRFWWVFFGLALVLLSGAVLADNSTHVYVNPAHTDVSLGNGFSVTVDINTDQNVYAAQFDLYFDNSRLNATSAVEGDFLKKGGTSTYPIITVNNSIGKISYACTRLGTQTGATGTGSLLAINFGTLGFGTSALDLGNLALSDNNLQQITATFANGSVKVNRLPSAGSLQIAPASPLTDDDLIGSYVYSDPDGDPESGSRIRWYKDGNHQPVYDDVLTVPAGATSKGEQWHFTVEPGDGFGFGSMATSPTVTIGNTPPTAPAVDVTPDTPLTEDGLACTAMGSTDADGDGIAYSYAWYKNGVLQGETSSTVASGLTGKGETWKCEATPSDGTEEGPSGEDEVTVQNSAPVITSFDPAGTVLETREGFSVQFDHDSSDPDGDSLAYSWELDGTEKAKSKSWMYSPTTADCGSRNVLLTVSDGLLADTQPWAVDVGLSGDVDSDSDVDIFDLAAVGLAFGSLPGDSNWNGDADINPGPGTDGTPEGDGQVNIFDLAMVGLNYGRNC